MTTYVYETIPQHPDQSPTRFEVRQGINDPKLTIHPDSGKPVRRLVSGGFTMLKSPTSSVGSVTDPSFHLKD